MMMSVLQAGGVTLLQDGLRAPDAHNPRGYFEYQPVRHLARDNSWLEAQRGRAVKIIYRLLYHLPPQLPARILFMERNLDEVVESQRRMLGQAEDGRDWRKIFSKELQDVQAWLRRQPQLQVLRVNFAELLRRPLPQSQRVAAFLDRPLDPDKMAKVVEPR